jgi:hypothetical protein
MPHETNRPIIGQEEMNKKVGSDMPERKPLPLLPEREWINATIIDVKYQVAMFNNQVQYMTYKDDEGKDVEILDDEGNKIMRKEFEIVFALEDYMIPGKDDKRKAWLRMGASFGDKAHLPQLLYNVLGAGIALETPADIITALKRKPVKLQVANKLSKDKEKTYQNVVWDAVKSREAIETPVATPITDAQVDPDPQPVDPVEPQTASSNDYCQCGSESRPTRVEKNGQILVECGNCLKPVVAWDE